MACYTVEGLMCSAVVEVSCSATIGLVVCFVVCSTIGCSGLVVSSVVCSTMGYSSYTSLGDEGIVVVWVDEEESLLQMFFLRP